MKKIELSLKGAYIIEPDVYKDNRGWFVESYNFSKFCEIDLNINFVQDNHSMSLDRNVLRGLHFQNNPKSQTKLVRCTRGRIMDVIVDLRVGSPTFLMHEKIELSEDNFRLLFVPKGFAHGFLTLTENVEVMYKVDEFYSKEHDRSIRFDDPDLDINWGCESPIMSDKDKNALFLKNSDVNFIYKENL